MTDNKIFEFTINYLAAFVEGQFSHINGLTRTSCEIWLKNEGLPTRESLIELYLWFLNEREVGRKEAMGDLVLLNNTCKAAIMIFTFILVNSVFLNVGKCYI